MKFKEDFLTAANTGISYAEFFKNPTIKEYSNLESYIEFKEVKAIITDNDLYVWNDSSLYHINAIEYLTKYGFDNTKQWFPVEIRGYLNKAVFIFMTSTANMFELGSVEELKKMVNNNPIINKLFNNIIVESVKLKPYISLYKEFTINDIKGQLSPIIKNTYSKRKKIKGSRGRASQFIEFDTKKGIAKFLVEPTNKSATQVVDLNGNLRPDTVYETSIEFVDYDKWVDDPKNLTLDEWKQILTVADVKIHCNCGSFHWTGLRYQWSELDSAIYPLHIADPVWRKRHTEGGVPSLCKHLEEVILKIRRYPMQIYNDIKKKSK